MDFGKSIKEAEGSVGCKWIFVIKRDAADQILCYEARLVAHGFSQQYGTDYNELYAPVVQQTTFRTLMAMAANERMIVKQYDIKTTFLRFPDLQEEFYMKQRSGFISKGIETKDGKLLKSLYELKQAAKSWSRKLHQELFQQGFEKCKSGPFLYWKCSQGFCCYVLVCG